MTVFIGAGAGFAGDRADASVAVVETLSRRRGPRYLIFEVLAERTLGLAQLERRRDPRGGHAPRTLDFLRPVLRACRDHGIRIVANFGAANPAGAGRVVRAFAQELGVDLRVAVVEGDDLLGYVEPSEIRSWPVADGNALGDRPIISANAYLGAAPMCEALALGADIVLVGRTADSALALAPLIHELGWGAADLDLLAAGTLAGHLVECGAQVSGGYFADPGLKDVPDLANVGFPIVEVDGRGAITLSKAERTGGRVSMRTVKEQLLYEVHDPAAYLVPDVTMDLSEVEVTDVGPDRVLVTGVRGHAPPPTLKVTVCAEGGYLGEAEISYGGANALARAELAARVLAERLRDVADSVRLDIVGTVSTLDSDAGALRRERSFPADGDYRLRVAGDTPDRAGAERLVAEVVALYTNGPGGGGGVRSSVAPRVRTGSVLMPRERVRTNVRLLGPERT